MGFPRLLCLKMIYRLLAKFNDDFGLFVFFLYLAAFLLAFVMVFIFPPGALALMLLGLVGFVGVWLIVVVMRSFERLLALKALGEDRCPCCSHDQGMTITPSSEWDSVVHCGGCGQHFESGGRRVPPEDEDHEEGSD